MESAATILRVWSSRDAARMADAGELRSWRSDSGRDREDVCEDSVSFPLAPFCAAGMAGCGVKE